MRYWYAPLEKDPRFENYYGMTFTSPDHENHSGLYIGEIRKDQYDAFELNRQRSEEQIRRDIAGVELDELGLPIETDDMGLPL